MGGEPVPVQDARAIFSGIAPDYDGPAQVFGLWRYRAWHRELAKLVAARKPRRVLDMCTGTGAIADAILARSDAQVVAVDVTRAMLCKARLRPRLVEREVLFVEAAAEMPPLCDGAFDAVVFSYLLRYVDDVPGTIAGLGRLVRPGGLLASLEFGVPPNPLLRGLWSLYTRGVMRAGLALLSPGWRRVGGFLGESIVGFYQRHPLPALAEYLRAAGFAVHPPRLMSAGAAIIMSATRLGEARKG